MPQAHPHPDFPMITQNSGDQQNPGDHIEITLSFTESAQSSAEFDK